MEYVYDEKTNTVKAIMHSNEKLKDSKVSWKLDEDLITYSTVLKGNGAYVTSVEDIYGNSTKVPIKVTQIDEVGPVIKTEYIYDEEFNVVTVNLSSNEKLGDTKKTWSLSDDGTMYSIKLKGNGSYNTIVEDIYGNKTSVNICVNCIKEVVSCIDVSKYNGNIDWKTVKHSGINYAMIRVGYRGWGKNGNFALDSSFYKNIEGAKKAGLKVGIYFYSQAVTRDEAIEEAKWVINKIKNYDIDLPVAIDVEESTAYLSGEIGRADLLDKETRTAIVDAFCKTIANEGYIPMVYINTYWSKYYVDMSKLLNYDTWIAHYTSADKPGYSGKYSMWQYTSNGVIPGIDGNVDLNRLYKNY